MFEVYWQDISLKMKNWSGNQSWSPEKVFYPQSEDEIVEIVKQALETKKKVRVIGSGHSFTALCVTYHFLISLDKFQGLLSTNNENLQVTVKAGTKLNNLNEILALEGLALPNMGDINVQSVAGAISTGTHGTGSTFGNMSTQVTALKFVNGLGELVTCSEHENKSLFKAAQVSLGALGILTEITLQCVPSYTLEMRMDRELLDDVLLSYTKDNLDNRNYEFFWFPNSPYVMTKRSNLTTAPPDKSSFKAYFNEMVMENYAFKLMCELAYRFPSKTHQISNFTGKTVSSHIKISESHNVFSTPRIVLFNEMEYNVPLAAYADVKKDIVSWINKNNKNVMFPIENRFVAGDDIYLSPAYQRDSAYIAVHVYQKKDYKPYFQALETIFKAYNGRPHWGKMHTLDAAEIESRYPKFNDFKNIREAQDPNGVFLSPYLQELFVK